MKQTTQWMLAWLLAVITCCPIAAAAGEPPQTGPETERRFPPLKVPTGFKATLFACDPLIEYPSVISVGPRPGALFVAVDYMTGLGTEITRRSEVRLVEDTNGDGYADKATLYAGGFNSIMGLAYHDGTVFVMHAPFLTALRDTKGTGTADERKDLLTGLGLTPEENPVRLHCANGVTVGHDGWLYLALGDHGCEVPRPEGDRLVLHGGGILRCRFDGRDLHVFSTGLRNIYDVALDAELNVFTRDNENDGGDYKIRVCHSFFGADHGYPYLYYERPDEALPPIADLGLGSSAGGVCYLETHFPKEYRGNLLFCEWGKSLVRYELKREGSSFAKPEEIEFATSSEGDPYGFKPTDVVVQRDGTLMVSDYADGQRPKRGRGRIYHIAHTVHHESPSPKSGDDETELQRRIKALDSESYYERWEAQTAIERAGEEGQKAIDEALAAGKLGRLGKLHAIWVIAHVRGTAAIEPLFKVAESDRDQSVQAQAVRAIADLTDPVLTTHRLDAEPGDAKVAERLAKLGRLQQQNQLRLEVVIALGRLRWKGLPNNLGFDGRRRDPAFWHAAGQALRRVGNWPATLTMLDAPPIVYPRGVAFHALAEQHDPIIVEGLIKRLLTAKNGARRRECADLLTRVYKKPGPWVYWDYRPKPRPANTVAWEWTDAIGEALDRVLLDPDWFVRVETLKRMQREKIPVGVETLGKWLSEERDAQRVAVLLDALRDQPPGEIEVYLQPVVRDARQSNENRLAALAILFAGIDEGRSGELIKLAQALEDSPVLAAVLRRISKYPKLDSRELLLAKLTSLEPDVRAAAIEVAGVLQIAEAKQPLLELLADRDALVRQAAATAAAKLDEKRSIETLLKLVADSDPAVRRAALESLHLFKEPRAVPLAAAALGHPEVDLTALELLRELGGVEQAEPVVALTKSSPSSDVLVAALGALAAWRDRSGATAEEQTSIDRAIAEIHAATGSLVYWNVGGPLPIADPIDGTKLLGKQGRLGTDAEGRIRLASKSDAKNGSFFATTEVFLSESLPVEFLSSSSGTLQVWLNGKPIYERKNATEYRPDADRFSASLAKGDNRLTVVVSATEAPPEFHLRFRRKSDVAAHERLIQLALSRTGNAERGRQVLLNAEKSLCLKCHRLDDRGEKAGPELTGLGSRFPRIYIAESILQPSRTIGPAFGTLVVRTSDGKTHSGIKVAETETTITLVDNQAVKQAIAKADIEEQKVSPISTMPEGLEKKFSEDEFVDMVAFLASLKKP